jgi:hypothetical protein
MTNVIRMVNGGTIQVRTGVLAGIGPQGPRGLIGPPGIDGPQGSDGPEGPIGQILQKQSRANVSGTVTVLSAADTLLPFATVAYDDLSCFASTTNIVLGQVGDYQFNVWVGVNSSSAACFHDIWIQSVTNGLVARTSHYARVDGVTYVEISHPLRSTVANEVVNCYIRTSDPVSTGITLGAISVTRTGSGSVGPEGPAGPVGPPGPVGPTGPIGPTGSASGGFATYGDLTA